MVSERENNIPLSWCTSAFLFFLYSISSIIYTLFKRKRALKVTVFVLIICEVQNNGTEPLVLPTAKVVTTHAINYGYTFFNKRLRNVVFVVSEGA
jgi:hypothetical protein